MSSEPVLPSTAKKNVETIAQVEQQLLSQRSPTERLGERIARFFGSLSFIIAQVLFITAWILLNTTLIPGAPIFDPYPFALLSFVVGVEFIFLTTFVLMNQSQQMRRAEQWAHVHLQLSVLTEQEVTKNMQLVHLICQHLRLEQPAHDPEMNELSQTTSVTALVDEIGKVRELGQALSDKINAVEKAGETST